MTENNYLGIEERFGLMEILIILRRKWKILVAITVGFIAISLFLSFQADKNKESIIYHVAEVEVTMEVDEDYPSQYQVLRALPESSNVAEKIKNSLKLEETIPAIKSGITLLPNNDNNSLLIKFKSTKADQALMVVDAIADESMKIIKESIPDVKIEITRPTALSPDKIVQNVSTNFLVNGIVGFILGIIVSVALIFLLDYLNNNILTVNDLERKLGLKLLGSVPYHVNDKRGGNNL